MKKRFSINDMTVRNKITLFSVLMLILMLIISSVGIWSSNMVNQARTSLNNSAMAQYDITQAFANFCNIKVRVRNILFAYYDDPEALQQQEQMIATYKADAQEYFELFEKRAGNMDPEMEAEYKAVVNKINSWYDSTQKDIDMAKAGQVEQAVNELMTNSKTIADDAESTLVDLISTMETAARAKETQIQQQLTGLTILQVAVIIVAVLITVMYCMFLIRAITGPMAKLSEAARRMAEGEVDVDCQKIYNDDLGLLLDEFAQMADAVKEQTKITEAISHGNCQTAFREQYDAEQCKRGERTDYRWFRAGSECQPGSGTGFHRAGKRNRAGNRIHG